MMPLWIPADLWRAVRKPIRKCHITMCQVERIVLSSFGSYRVLLREHKAHDLSQFDVVEEEMDVDRVGREFCWAVGLVVDEVVFCTHLHIGVVNVDGDWATECDCDRAITCEECPPYSLPQPLVRLGEL